MSKDDFYTEEEMAKLMKIDVSTLKQYRCRRKLHPPFVKISRSVVIYPKDKFNEWMDDKTKYELTRKRSA